MRDLSALLRANAARAARVFGPTIPSAATPRRLCSALIALILARLRRLRRLGAFLGVAAAGAAAGLAGVAPDPGGTCTGPAFVLMFALAGDELCAGVDGLNAGLGADDMFGADCGLLPEEAGGANTGPAFVLMFALAGDMPPLLGAGLLLVAGVGVAGVGLPSGAPGVGLSVHLLGTLPDVWGRGWPHLLGTARGLGGVAELMPRRRVVGGLTFPLAAEDAAPEIGAAADCIILLSQPPLVGPAPLTFEAAPDWARFACVFWYGVSGAAGTAGGMRLGVTPRLACVCWYGVSGAATFTRCRMKRGSKTLTSWSSI
jgi:hypothetical protein